MLSILKDPIGNWEIILKELKSFTSSGLALLADMEFDGDPNNGITELSFKLLLLGALASPTECLGNLRVESEYSVEGGRIDLILFHDQTKSALVMELKYNRTGFYVPTAVSFKFKRTFPTRWTLALQNGNEEIKRMSLDKLDEAEFQTNGKSMKIYQKRKNAKDQLERYCRSLREGGVRRIPKETRIYQVVFFGIGKRVEYYDLKEA